jgi:hypothetical protein
MIAYRILKNGYYGGDVMLPDNQKGTPPYVTRTPVPSIPEGSYAIWNGRGWTITATPPRPDNEPPKPTTITVEDLFDKFGVDKWNILSSQDPLIKAFLLDCSVRKTVDIADSNFVSVIKYMVDTFNFAIDSSLIEYIDSVDDSSNTQGNDE